MKQPKLFSVFLETTPHMIQYRMERPRPSSAVMRGLICGLTPTHIRRRRGAGGAYDACAHNEIEARDAPLNPHQQAARRIAECEPEGERSHPAHELSLSNAHGEHNPIGRPGEPVCEKFLSSRYEHDAILSRRRFASAAQQERSHMISAVLQWRAVCTLGRGGGSASRVSDSSVGPAPMGGGRSVVHGAHRVAIA